MSRKKETDVIPEEAEFVSESVICPCCGGIFFETTPQYNPEGLVTPGMITLKEPYKSYGWAEVVLDGYSGHGALTCPECEGMLSPDGKLKLLKGDCK